MSPAVVNLSESDTATREVAPRSLKVATASGPITSVARGRVPARCRLRSGNIAAAVAEFKRLTDAEPADANLSALIEARRELAALR